MQQSSLNVFDIKIPFLIDENEKWYPISYINKHILLRGKGNPIKNTYQKYIKQININYDVILGVGGIQEVSCVNEEGVKKWFSSLNIGTLSDIQKNNINEFRNVLGLNRLEDNVVDSNVKIDSYVVDTIMNDEVDELKRCIKCGNKLPASTNFFYNDDRRSDGLSSICKLCCNKKFKANNTFLDLVYMKYGEQMYEKVKNSTIEDIYTYYLRKEIDIVPNTNDENVQFSIIKRLFDEKLITIKDINCDYIKNIFGKKNIVVKMERLYDYVAPKWRKFYYRYPNFIFKGMTDKDGIVILKNYIDEHGIVIDDVYNYDYVTLFKNARVYCLAGSNLLGFVMKFYNDKYPSYKFKIVGNNYYKELDNRKLALKYYIEKDLKIIKDRIPLYITKYKMNQHSITMYNILRKYYDGSIYKWVNEVYPNFFKEEDFKMECIRTQFDSFEEQVIDGELRKHFKYNVLHNISNEKDTLRIFGKQPDWFIIRDNVVWVVEYFGLYNEDKSVSKINKIYNEKHDVKLELYKTNNDYYKYMFIYKKDLDNEMEGLKYKIDRVIENNENIVS